MKQAQNMGTPPLHALGIHVHCVPIRILHYVILWYTHILYSRKWGGDISQIGWAIPISYLQCFIKLDLILHVLCVYHDWHWGQPVRSSRHSWIMYYDVCTSHSPDVVSFSTTTFVWIPCPIMSHVHVHNALLYKCTGMHLHVHTWMIIHVYTCTHVNVHVYLPGMEFLWTPCHVQRTPIW